MSNHGINTIEDIQALFNLHGPEKAGEILRRQALEGNALCQVFLSGAGLQIPKEQRNESINKDIDTFTRLAAMSGDIGSQFNLALLHIQKVNLSQEYFSADDVDNLKEAKRWHQQAASNGFAPSVQSLENLKSIFNLMFMLALKGAQSLIGCVLGLIAI